MSLLAYWQNMTYHEEKLVHEVMGTFFQETERMNENTPTQSGAPDPIGGRHFVATAQAGHLFG